MQKWEYCSLTIATNSAILWHYKKTAEDSWYEKKAFPIGAMSETIVKLGLEGWELVNVRTDVAAAVYYFKRPL